MKSYFSPGLILVAAASTLLAFGCADAPDNHLDSDETAVNENNADWIRVDLNLESNHPYENNQEENWELQAPEQAQGIRVHFDEFETEADKDFLIIGEHIYHGSLGSFTSDVSAGNLVPVQFSTDESITHYGYNIDYYEYLMPHKALAANTSNRENHHHEELENKLKLGHAHHADTHIKNPRDDHHHSFEEAHYEELIEHQIVYRCWRTIPFIHVPEPFTLALAPTSAFSVNLVSQVHTAAKHPQRTLSLFQNKALPLNIKLTNFQMTSRMAEKVMSQTSVKKTRQPIKISTKSIRIGFGAWRLAKFNQKSQHTNTRPQLNRSQRVQMKIKSTKSQAPFFRSFKLKSFKI